MLKKNNNISKINKGEIINIINKNNNEDLFEEEYFYINLFTIILNDYENYPNFNHIITILNIEKFIVLYYGEFNKIQLIYKFDKKNIKDNKLEIFGRKFVEKNKENCFMIINEKNMELSRFITLFDIFGKANFDIDNSIIIEINLIKIKNQKKLDLSYMFYEISTIMPTSVFEDLNGVDIINMSCMFYNCSSLTELPDISHLNTTNVEDMSYMFYNCSSIIELPANISEWKTENVKNTSHMFENCESLLKLPDISKWTVKNNKNMNKMFRNCKSLSSMPDLSVWGISKDTDINDMFEDCKCFEEKRQEINCRYFNKLIRKKKILTICFLLIGVLGFFEIIYDVLYPLFVLPYVELYDSFQFDKANELISNPTIFFNLRKYSVITKNSITNRIAYLMKITDYELIKEISEKEEYFMNYLINITMKENFKLEIESRKQKYKKYNAFHYIFYCLRWLLFIFVFKKNLIKFINKNIMSFSILLVVICVFTLIIEILDNDNIDKLFDKIKQYIEVIEMLFVIEITVINSDDIAKLQKYSKEFNNYLIISIIFIILASLRLIYLIYQNNKQKTLEYFLLKNKNKISNNSSNLNENEKIIK